MGTELLEIPLPSLQAAPPEASLSQQLFAVYITSRKGLLSQTSLNFLNLVRFLLNFLSFVSFAAPFRRECFKSL